MAMVIRSDIDHHGDLVSMTTPQPADLLRNAKAGTKKMNHRNGRAGETVNYLFSLKIGHGLDSHAWLFKMYQFLCIGVTKLLLSLPSYDIPYLKWSLYYSGTRREK